MVPCYRTHLTGGLLKLRHRLLKRWSPLELAELMDAETAGRADEGGGELRSSKITVQRGIRGLARLFGIVWRINHALASFVYRTKRTEMGECPSSPRRIPGA